MSFWWAMEGIRCGFRWFVDVCVSVCMLSLSDFIAL